MKRATVGEAVRGPPQSPNATWLLLKMIALTALKPGDYAIGVLLAADVNCFAFPGRTVEAYAQRPFFHLAPRRR